MRRFFSYIRYLSIGLAYSFPRTDLKTICSLVKCKKDLTPDLLSILGSAKYT